MELPKRPWNYRAAQILTPVGLILLATHWRDLGLTLLALAAINYVLYRRDNGWVIV